MAPVFPINEMFETLQSEASLAGTPSVFIRLQGCGVGCPWCDTKHTWEVKPDYRISSAVMMEKQQDAPTYAEMSVIDLISAVEQLQSRHIVLTGGEPCDYDLVELTAALMQAGKTVQIETSGTAPVRVTPGTWVTCSPKVGMPGGFKVLPEVVRWANEVKMPVGKMRDIETLTALLAETGAEGLVFLQPLSTNDKATQLCIEEARKRGWRVSLQMHKYRGLR